MDKLMDLACAFEELLDIRYHIILGRKGKTTELWIGFSKLDLHHLIGLGKLKDLRIATKNRGAVFDEMLSGKTTYESISKSRYIHLIKDRFEPLAHIEQLFDDNRLIFRYDPRRTRFSLIEADYLLSTPYAENDIYIFLARHKDVERYFCRSFFPKDQTDYTRGQAVYTMLYKEKIHLSTGVIQVQYDRFSL